jgi:flagellin
MRELAVQSAADTNETTVDRAALQAEFQQLQQEINDTAAKTKFNDMGVIDGSYEVTEFYVQSGANEGDFLSINISAMDAPTIGVDFKKGVTVKENADDLSIDPENVHIANRVNASAAITAVNSAINAVSTQRAKLGALMNRLQHKINNLDTSAENLSAAEARIRDVDMAKEMTNYTRWTILSQASTAMLAQANQQPQGVLQLLG